MPHSVVFAFSYGLRRIGTSKNERNIFVVGSDLTLVDSVLYGSKKFRPAFGVNLYFSLPPIQLFTFSSFRLKRETSHYCTNPIANIWRAFFCIY